MGTTTTVDEHQQCNPHNLGGKAFRDLGNKELVFPLDHDFPTISTKQIR
ncbi:hypothetical protein [Pedobacter sp. SYSU D00535]|nr:hypothetical protein [Pedobacter sp. SYSU D00535]